MVYPFHFRKICVIILSDDKKIPYPSLKKSGINPRSGQRKTKKTWNDVRLFQDIYTKKDDYNTIMYVRNG